MLKPTGFWSYTSSDDIFSRGKLSQLRSLLAEELQQQIGRAPVVNIWQDVAAIPSGSDWERQIKTAIENTSFLIIVVTPALLQSEWCCKEIQMFRRREINIGSDRLIFPIHFIDTSHLEPNNPNDCHDPTIFEFLHSRQWADFRSHRLSDYNSSEVGRFLENISRAIRTALRQDLICKIPMDNSSLPIDPTDELRLNQQRVKLISLIHHYALHSKNSIVPYQNPMVTVEDKIIEDRSRKRAKNKYKSNFLNKLCFIGVVLIPTALSRIGYNIYPDYGNEIFSSAWYRNELISIIMAGAFLYLLLRLAGHIFLDIISMTRSLFKFIRYEEEE
ncbi:toll/interleukin-1 receptor domain-containing protein [Methylobacterium sp. SI9]|uniref:toll/interleukin-1 receptor domain-containing protein n=1 Tax=Methylobacterium guangdongense TaxID=3138811 RepID=UPI00313E8728